MKVKIEFETDEERDQLTKFLTSGLLDGSLSVKDIPAARGVLFYIKGMRPHERAQQLAKSALRSAERLKTGN